MEINQKQKRPWVASLLSLPLPGLGHAYAGKPKKAILIYIVFQLLAVSPFLIGFSFLVFAGIIAIAVVYYLYAIINAFITVKRTPTVASQPYDKWYIYLTMIILQVVLIEVVVKPNLKETPIKFYSITFSSMQPALQVGDGLAVTRTKNIKLNDVVMFKYPENPVVSFVSRCKGMPGTTLEIKNDLVYTNGKLTDKGENLKFRHTVKSIGRLFNKRMLAKYGVTNSYPLSPNMVAAFLTKGEAAELAKNSGLEVKQTLGDSGYLFPKASNTGWTLSNYGPIRVPKKGEKVALSKANVALYGELIKQENQGNCFINDEEVNINNQVVKEYTFKQNYYFVLGDNRHNALDSRHWGFVKEEYIMSKVLYVYWSDATNKIGQAVK